MITHEDIINVIKRDDMLTVEEREEAIKLLSSKLDRMCKVCCNYNTSKCEHCRDSGMHDKFEGGE